jgi:antitoxin component YwqK of YwqJK toxin-antitoxin module
MRGVKRAILIVTLLGAAFAIHAQETAPNVTDAKGRKQGKWIKKYDKSDVPRYIGQFKDDKPYGEFKYYYESGHIKSRMVFNKDGKTSRATIYYEDGKKMSFGRYTNQKKDSVWTHYDPEGWVNTRETYVNDKLDGKVWIYYAPSKDRSGAVAQEFTYKNGLKDGEWKRYFEAGTTMSTGTYKNGLLDGVVTHFMIDGKKEVSETYWKGRLHGPRIQYENNVEVSRTYYKDDKKLEGKDLENFLKEEKQKKEEYYNNQKKGTENKKPNNAPKPKPKTGN